MIEEQKLINKIIEFIHNNPVNCNKQKIVDYLSEAGLLSRGPAFKLLQQMEKDEIINAVKGKQNSRDYKLSVNTENIILISISNELDEFENAFIKFLDKSKERIRDMEKNLSIIANDIGIREPDPYKWKESDNLRYLKYEMKSDLDIGTLKKRFDDIEKEFNAYPDKNYSVSIYKNVGFNLKDKQKQDIEFLTHQGAFLIFKMFTDAYSCRSIAIWPYTIKNVETLKKVYSIVFIKIAEIQAHLATFLRTSNLLKNKNITEFMVDKYFDVKSGIFTDDDYSILMDLEKYEEFGLDKELSPIIYSILKITNEITKYRQYREYSIFRQYSDLPLFLKALLGHRNTRDVF